VSLPPVAEATYARRRRITCGLVAAVAVLGVAQMPDGGTPAVATTTRRQADDGALVVELAGPDGASRAIVGRPASDPGCEEDEVAAVAGDHDPAHGLAWACVPLEELAP